MKKFGLILFALLLIPVISAQAQIALTVYNQDLGLVREHRDLQFQKGQFDLEFTDIPSSIDPTSVHFKLLDKPDAAVLLEQNYQYDLVSASKILTKFIGSEIEITAVAGDQGKFYSGELLAFDGNNVTLKTTDGGVKVIEMKWISDVSFEKLPEGLITKPTLVWRLLSDVAGKQKAEVSYLTQNINWHTEYVAVVSDDDSKLDLSGWVSVDNRTGATYKDAKLKLIAGDVNVVQPPPPSFRRDKGYALAAMSAEDASFEEKSFFEYHLYTLPRTTTIANNEIKQISLFEPATTPVVKVFEYEGWRYPKDIRIVLEFTNSKEAGLGMPLPAGKLRVMKRDTDGLMEFVGEDMIDHTPKDEDLKVFLGNAFDLVGERNVMDRKKITDRMTEETIEIKLRNHKDKDVTIKVVEKFGRYWEVRESNYEFTKKDASTAEFLVPVNADGDSTLSIIVRKWY
ncbi:MAG: DUF4139 domain-containing protein [candidate division Zixibacteria bacterium]|nr:DUF4139 domain-containing protein [candidate division Zixibacteria bacterium]MBU1469206.1 DUF4139 domain-containing protein [candidate division Zixibacteria bacterium]MBU2626556.1 DUF4139 domain-containing protein [candidate division Zixibacteria bacterium]